MQGIFPFQEAKKDDSYYRLILDGNLDFYWQKTRGTHLSSSFKDLIIKMFEYEGKNRPTFAEIKNHPWMK